MHTRQFQLRPWHLRHAPVLNPALWEHPELIGQNNCYTYAPDAPAVRGNLIPGAHPNLATDSSAAFVAALRADGLRPLTTHRSRHVGAGHVIAAASGTQRVMGQAVLRWHLWRLDQTGTWSSKHGDEVVTVTSPGGTQIRDVRNDLGDDDNFLGFWWVSPRKRARLLADLVAHRRD